MASFTCHVVCVTKRLRLERLVRPPYAELAPDPCDSPTPEANSTTSLAERPEAGACQAKARTLHSRGQELSLRPVRSRLGRSNLAESRACPKPRCCRADCRCLHRACEVQALRIGEPLQIAWNSATTVRETRPNARIKPCREAASA